MTNSNYGKIYNSFAEHPLAPIYLNHDIQYLLDIAYSPITAENTEIFTNIIAELIKIANEDDFNEFEELRLQLENPN